MLSLAATLLVACGSNIPRILSTLTPISSNPITTRTQPEIISPIHSTETPTATPKPAWQQTIETQDPLDSFFKIVDGQPAIDLYDTQGQESIALSQGTIKIKTTIDSLNPNILTAQDADDNQYAFNPDYGWFKVPTEIKMDFNKYREYTELPYRFFGDGTANVIAALRYAENPTISPKAVAPQYWANYGADGNSNFIYVGYRPSGDLGIAQKKWPDLIAKSYFKAENKPFAWTGFYKVIIGDNKYIYVVSRTIKTDNKVINLFYGFDQSTYENMAHSMTGDGITTELKLMFDGIDNGGKDLIAILAPPEEINGVSLSWNPDKVHRTGPVDPDVARLQKREEQMSLFSATDKQAMLDLLSLTPVEISPENKFPIGTSPLNSLPSELSKYILLPGRG